ncbi:MAG: hypothetical protein R3Y62_00475 [Eubacteriales bacterium]
MKQLSATYAASASLLRQRLRELRRLKKRATGEELWWLKRRIAILTVMLTQMNELEELTAHYYDEGYHRNEKYTL